MQTHDSDRHLRIASVIDQIDAENYGHLTRHARRTRADFRDARAAWNPHINAAYQRAQAEALIAVLGSVTNPTARHLLAYIGEGFYDVSDEDRVDVCIGDLIGLPGIGPTVAATLVVLEDLVATELEAVLDRPLVAMLLDQ